MRHSAHLAHYQYWRDVMCGARARRLHNAANSLSVCITSLTRHDVLHYARALRQPNARLLMQHGLRY